MNAPAAPPGDGEGYAIYILAPQTDAGLGEQLVQELARQQLCPPPPRAATGRQTAPQSHELQTLGSDCLRLRIQTPPRSHQALRTLLAGLAERWQVDLVCLREDDRRDSQEGGQAGATPPGKRLLVFDMDSTLIQMEMIDALAERAGVGDQVAAITHQAMNGAVDFRASLRQRVALLRGLPAEVLPQLAQHMPLQKGAQRLFASLREQGWHSAIVSGGFLYFGRILCERLHIRYLHANELEIRQGVLTGRIQGEIVDGDAKLRHTRVIARREGLDMSQVVAVGDGANDLPMLQAAGLGIAFHAKPKVRRLAPHCISRQGLDSILYLIGLQEQPLSR